MVDGTHGMVHTHTTIVDGDREGDQALSGHGPCIYGDHVETDILAFALVTSRVEGEVWPWFNPSHNFITFFNFTKFAEHLGITRPARDLRTRVIVVFCGTIHPFKAQDAQKSMQNCNRPQCCDCALGVAVECRFIKPVGSCFGHRSSVSIDPRRTRMLLQVDPQIELPVVVGVVLKACCFDTVLPTRSHWLASPARSPSCHWSVFHGCRVCHLSTPCVRQCKRSGTRTGPGMYRVGGEPRLSPTGCWTQPHRLTQGVICFVE